MAGIYLHIPFCKQACHYCDFHFSTVQKDRPALIDAMIKEIDHEAEFLKGQEIKTIYFGGGTPSLLQSSELARIFHAINKNYRVSSSPEITLEANPDDLSAEKLDALKSIGINRLSIGIQTFDDEILRSLNRAHSAQLAHQCLQDAKAAGFENITADLMYGLPGQTEISWKDDIAAFIKYDLPHLSAYSLTIEPRTVFGHRFAQQKLELPEESLVLEQFQFLMDFMRVNGFEHYEISNFAKPEHRSVHNTSYWLGEHYLGIGPSAHSYNGRIRRWNVANNAKYVRSWEKGQPDYEEEILTPTMKFNEYLLTSLRTNWGVNLDFVEKNFEPEFSGRLKSTIKPYLDSGHLLEKGRSVLLSEKGKFVADKITSDLFDV